MGFQLPFPQLSNEKNNWLVRLYRGWHTTQLYRDYFINHYTDPYFSQPGFNGKDRRVFCRGSTGAFPPDFWLPSTDMDLYTAGRCVAHRLRHLGGFALAHGLMQVTWLTKRTTLSERRSERNPNGHNIGSIWYIYIYMFDSIWDSWVFFVFLPIH